MDRHFDLMAVGESVIDMISTEFTDNLGAADTYQLFVGGQVTNLAMNTARLGKRVALATCWGNDSLGYFLETNLENQHVDLSYVQKTDRAPTTMAIIARNVRTPDFVIHRGADALFEHSPALTDALKHCRIVHTSAFALTREPARSAIFSVLEDAQQLGTMITFDPNYHPGTWPDNTDFISHLQRAFQLATVTKPSLDDCERILGPGKEPVEYAAEFKEWGARTVIITMGREGVFLSDDQDRSYCVQPNNVDVTDVTGAGDAFWSGLLVGLLEGMSMLRAVRIGQVMAEIKLESMGPIITMPSWEEITKRSEDISYRDC